MRKIVVITIFLILVMVKSVSAFELVQEKEHKFGIGGEYGALFSSKNQCTFQGVYGLYNFSDRISVQASIGRVYSYLGMKGHFFISGKSLYRFVNLEEQSFYVFGVIGNYNVFPSAGAGIGTSWNRFAKLHTEVGYTIDKMLILTSGFSLFF